MTQAPLYMTYAIKGLAASAGKDPVDLVKEVLGIKATYLKSVEDLTQEDANEILKWSLRKEQSATEGARRWLIVGLGNPGPEYANHRHNIGYMVVDNLLPKIDELDWTSTRWADFGVSNVIGEHRHSLIKPTLFMNSSGEAVAQFQKRLEALLEHIVVIHDDMDLPLGTLRIKVGGGDGGHRGIRSVVDELGTKEFIRVRLGIGRPPEGIKVLDYVLSPFLPEDQETVADLIQRGKKAVEMIISEGLQTAQNTMNGAGKKDEV